MKKVLRTAVVGVGAATVCFALAQPALAGSFSKNVGDGTVKYTDSTDKFCAQARNFGGMPVEGTRRTVTVKLTPISGSGPRYKWTDEYGWKNGSKKSKTWGATCRSLATAYEDTKYRAEVWSYWENRGTTVKRGTYTFHS
ncbi:hypothetical protein ACQPZP_36375 [Spirillospora sp. CA-142024]|uniref:hypothetical protein n=1 Tax=Spirillospora sp. CA-142024 TaxID=3240036 RepID=UPI003D927692